MVLEKRKVNKQTIRLIKMELNKNIKMYLMVPNDLSKEIASLVQTMKPNIIFIKLVVMNDVVINRQN